MKPLVIKLFNSTNTTIILFNSLTGLVIASNISDWETLMCYRATQKTLCISKLRNTYKAPSIFPILLKKNQKKPVKDSLLLAKIIIQTDSVPKRLSFASFFPASLSCFFSPTTSSLLYQYLPQSMLLLPSLSSLFPFPILPPSIPSSPSLLSSLCFTPPPCLISLLLSLS